VCGFQLLARFSRNPTIDSPARSCYPFSEGCLGEAWDAGSAAAVDLPEPTGAAWQRTLNRQWKIPNDVSTGFRMKSRNVIAVRLDGTDHPVGVIVFESRQSVASAPGTCRIGANDLYDYMKGEDGDRFASWLEACEGVQFAIVPVES
jgi:hypothetical protein